MRARRRKPGKVTDALPPPKRCRYCDAPVQLASHEKVYGRVFSDWPWIYLCTGCKAYVGTHPGTWLPLGTLADRRLRNARKTHKAAFEALRNTGMLGNRSQAYAWLARQLGISGANCHWGMFEEDQCKRAGELCRRVIRRGLTDEQLHGAAAAVESGAGQGGDPEGTADYPDGAAGGDTEGPATGHS